VWRCPPPSHQHTTVEEPSALTISSQGGPELLVRTLPKTLPPLPVDSRCLDVERAVRERQSSLERTDACSWKNTQPLDQVIGRPLVSYFDCEPGDGPPQLDYEARRCWARHKFKTGATYTGQWMNGERDGLGRQVWPDGSAYLGQWCDGRASGYGQMEHGDGDAYIGQWFNGCAHGRGVFRFQGGVATYEGEFRCDLRDGVGVEQWEDGSWYRGEFRQGAKCGHGETRWPDGVGYLGAWFDNGLSGAGRFGPHEETDEILGASEQQIDAPTYEGQWLDSAHHGFGLFLWPDGRKYAGHYKNDEKHGFGILSDPDGGCCEGFWERGRLLHAPGELDQMCI